MSTHSSGSRCLGKFGFDLSKVQDRVPKRAYRDSRHVPVLARYLVRVLQLLIIGLPFALAAVPSVPRTRNNPDPLEVFSDSNEADLRARSSSVTLTSRLQPPIITSPANLRAPLSSSSLLSLFSLPKFYPNSSFTEFSDFSINFSGQSLPPKSNFHSTAQRERERERVLRANNCIDSRHLGFWLSRPSCLLQARGNYY